LLLHLHLPLLPLRLVPCAARFPYTTLFRSIGVLALGAVQKHVARACRRRSRLLIVATGLFASMRSAEQPGISEVSDAGLLGRARSEEHTSELQSRVDLVWRLLLDKKKSQPD